MSARQERPKRETISRFQGKNGKCMMHLTKNSMFASVLIRDEKFVSGMRVHLEFFLNVKSEGEDKNLQPLGSKTTAIVQSDGKVVVVLAFGKQGSQETAYVSFCGIQLPQRVAPPKGEHLSLELVCAMRQCEQTPDPLRVTDDTEDNWLGQVHLQLMTSWSEAVFAHSSNLFESNAKEELPDFLPTALVFRLMQLRWVSAGAMFHLGRPSKLQDYKSRGKAIEEQHKDDECDSFPVLTKSCMLQMLRLVLSHSQWVRSDVPPQLISRKTFCGDGKAGVDKAASLWSVLETLLELVGRSLFVRRLFSAGQLHFLTADDVIELPVDLLTRLKSLDGHPPLLYLFRISRSLSSPAIVLDMLELVDGAIHKVQPSPYVTVDQIIAANGDVYKAFANLESVHHARLVSLNPAFRLYQIERRDANSNAKSFDSLSGRHVRCKIVGAADAPNRELKQSPDMSPRLWWAMPTKPATASFLELATRKELEKSYSPDSSHQGCGTSTKEEHRCDSLIESS